MMRTAKFYIWKTVRVRKILLIYFLIFFTGNVLTEHEDSIGTEVKGLTNRSTVQSPSSRTFALSPQP
jgi:hypothetical protein